MANIQCDACESLRENAPNFIVNGLDDEAVENLVDNKGLAGNSANCADVNDMNDCLIGMMERSVFSYETCNWKPFTKKLIGNIWTVLKAIISWLCGITCRVNYLQNGASIKIGEEPTDGSYVVAGKGCTFYEPDGSGDHISDVSLLYIAGGLVRLTGSCNFYAKDFKDYKACPNFDNGYSVKTSKDRSGNSVWGKEGKPATGGELVYEIRIDKSQYPQISRLYSGRGMESAGGAFHAQALVFNEGTWAYGQHGWCHTSGDKAGEPMQDGYDKGHKVPEGFIYVQCRLSWIDEMSANGNQYTPYMFMGIRTKADEIKCDVL